VLSAIVIVGSEIREEREGEVSLENASSEFPLGATPLQQRTPLACVEVLGRSLTGRLVDELRRAEVDAISVFADATIAPRNAGVDSSANVALYAAEDPWDMAAQKLADYAETEIEAILVMRGSAYVEFDLTDFLQSHREQGRAVTRAFNHEGPLDIWIIDKVRLAEGDDMLTILRTYNPARYGVRGYVNRLEHPRDLRRLVVDGLTSRCRFHPLASEIRPGVWIDEGAQVNRDARIVAPAFIGRGSRVEAQCLITRCSNIESNCQVDYGTVMEDSSILSNTYIGIGLDLSHSIVDGSNLLNLERNVTLEIADPCVIRPNRVASKQQNRHAPMIVGFGGAQFAPAEEGSR
jgi:tetrahydrodipicolinate N-succinyltransferase